MAKLRVRRKSHPRKSHIRGGRCIKRTRVDAATFLVKDTGKPGRTPKGERFFEPTVETGWS